MDKEMVMNRLLKTEDQYREDRKVYARRLNHQARRCSDFAEDHAMRLLDMLFETFGPQRENSTVVLFIPPVHHRRGNSRHYVLQMATEKYTWEKMFNADQGLQNITADWLENNKEEKKWT